MFEKELEFISENVKHAYTLFLKDDNGISDKGEYDLVTDLDIKIEKYLIEEIHKTFPGDTILSEEILNNSKIDRQRTWIIDPIDGTVNYAHGIEYYGIQCALLVDNEPVLSYLYAPIFNNEYYAIVNSGAYMNNKKISIDRETPPNKAIVSIGDYSHRSDVYFAKLHSFVKNVSPKISKIRMFGSSLFDFTYCATNKINACVMFSENLWDIIPGMFLCKEAGLNVVSITGDPYKIGDGPIVVSNSRNLLDLILQNIPK